MIKFYADEDGIQYGGYFIEGNKVVCTYDEEETQKLQRWIDDGTAMDDLNFHYLTPVQLETFKQERGIA